MARRADNGPYGPRANHPRPPQLGSFLLGHTCVLVFQRIVDDVSETQICKRWFPRYTDAFRWTRWLLAMLATDGHWWLLDTRANGDVWRMDRWTSLSPSPLAGHRALPTTRIWPESAKAHELREQGLTITHNTHCDLTLVPHHSCCGGGARSYHAAKAAWHQGPWYHGTRDQDPRRTTSS